MVVDGLPLDTVFITPNRLVRKSIWLKKESYADGEIILGFKKIKGKRVVCSEMGLYEFPKEQSEKRGYGGSPGQEQVMNLRFFIEQVYPNPTRGMLIISFNSPDQRKIEIKLYDVCGRCVHRQNITRAKIGMNEVMIVPEGLSAGVYFVQLDFGTQTATRKVVMIK